jgi:hypothetical protein
MVEVHRDRMEGSAAVYARLGSLLFVDVLANAGNERKSFLLGRSALTTPSSASFFKPSPHSPLALGAQDRLTFGRGG